MLNIVTWFWGNKYDPVYVIRLYASVEKYLQQPHRFIVVTDGSIRFPEIENFKIPIQDYPYLQMKGCFARLRMFDPEWQKELKLEGRIASIDIDTVVTGELDPIFERDEPFVILKGANAANPCPYTACIFMFQAGAHPELWTSFSQIWTEPGVWLKQNVPFYEFPDDQGWMHHKIPNAATWQVGSASGIYAFQKPGWPKGSTDLPADARIVMFPGSRDPSKFQHLPWIRKHWLWT